MSRRVMFMRDHAEPSFKFKYRGPYQPGERVKCVWCDREMPGYEWRLHMLETHYDECHEMWEFGIQRDRRLGFKRDGTKLGSSRYRNGNR